MIEILVGLSLIGLASYYDLKTTEIPDWIPIVLIIFAIGYSAYNSITLNNFEILKNSLIFGSIFSLIGYLMYKFGQWGGGDSFLLAAIAFLFPQLNFLAKYYLNLIILGAIYIIIYSIVYCTLFERKVFKIFVKSLKKESKSYILIFSTLLISLSIFSLTLKIMNISLIIFQAVLLTSLLITYKFLKLTEIKAFRRKIPINELKVGDVLVSFKVWRGITEKEIEELKKSGKVKFVEIKDGVRFAPAFLIALIYTLYFKDVLFLSNLIPW